MNERKNILVLGAGMMGRAIALDLNKNGHRVSVLDNDIARLALFHDSDVATVHSDMRLVSDYASHIKNADIIVGAMPGHFAFTVLKELIPFGKDIVDISFFDEDPFELDALAKEYGVTVAVDMGVAPGMSNAIAGRENACMRVDSIICRVGGLPVRRDSVSGHLGPFAVESIFDEYTRPARMRKYGRNVTEAALSEPECVYLDGIGELVAVNTDGARTLLKTMPDVPTIVEKTLRYPEHITLMHALKKMGFFSEKPLALGGDFTVKPVDITRKLLCDAWRMDDHEPEFTVMTVEIKGRKNKILKTAHEITTVTYSVLDYGDIHTSSMARTTGYMATATTELFLSGRIPGKGMITPEEIGANEACFSFILKYMQERGVVYKRKEHSAPIMED